MEVSSFRYCGELTREELISAHDKAIANASHLLAEAKVLFENDRYSRSYYLLCICNEELGKSLLILSSIADLIDEKIDWKKFWRIYRNHKVKRGILESMEAILAVAFGESASFNSIRDNLKAFEEFKMASLYSDIQSGVFAEPNELIKKDIAELMLSLSTKRFTFITSIPITNNMLETLSKEDIRKSRIARATRSKPLK